MVYNKQLLTLAILGDCTFRFWPELLKLQGQGFLEFMVHISMFSNKVFPF